MELTTIDNNWQRLSPWALVFLVVNGLIKAVRQNIGFFLGAGAGFVFLDWIGPRELGLGALALLLVIVIVAMIHHRRFRFRLEGDAIRIRSGLLAQKELRIRFARVLNVNLSQPFYLRALDLVRFSLGTAGAAQKEVELPGISRLLAEAMRERIAAARADAEPAADTEAPSAAVTGGIMLHRAGDGDLLLHGLASNQVWVMAGAFFGMLGVFQRRISDWAYLETLGDQLLTFFGHALTAAIVLGLGVLLVIMLLSVLVSWVRFSGYQLERAKGRFRSRAGLLDRKEQTVPVEKLHAFELVQTAIGRVLGRWYLMGRQAATMGRQDAARQGSFLVPGLNRDAAFDLLAKIEPEAGEYPELEKIVPLFKRVMGLRVLLLFIIAAGTSMLVWSWNLWLAGTMIIAIAPALALIHLRWHQWGYAYLNGRLWIRRGLFGQHRITFALDRVQQVAVRQSPAQYRKNIANLILILPHGPVTLPFLPLADANRLANETLYQAETALAHRI